ncbi:hypothetical protein EG19_02985 [Thermoanaerobaculum aquaticum]|uniref:PatA-like N-terminal domain-containing protein n=1 Tax=Thermoanaerobaculum aquaticum TaxID=1312852 RepID=A0A062XS72_9BACT|nr:DUF4388 domain-containing protein [Thermoanaerobaculum aquaticum]KDA53693.1 hypothetical protein EG19_02985 [Thermoanaerobaculum aquaticum]GBC78896.1 hypothetical protein HRbin09_00105 [bacterium HR09]
MALTGDLRTLPFPEVIQLVARMGGTGVLRVRRGQVEKAVYFRKGAICSSSSNDPREFLGQYLLRMGLVDEEHLFQALLKQDQEHRPLGAILIELGLLAPDDLEKVLRQKAEETIYDLFLWDEGEFVFHEEPIPENLPVQLNLDVMGVLLEGARRSDEWERIRQVIPSPRTTFAPGPVPPADVTEARVVSLAAEGRTAAAISFELHCSDFDAFTLLASLVQKQVLQVKSPGAAERPGDTVGTVKKLLAKAKSAELAGRLEEAEEAYEAVLLINPVHVQARKALTALRERSLTPADPSAFNIPPLSPRPAETVPLDGVPRLAVDFSTVTRLELSPEEGYLLSRINGSWDVKSIVRLFPEGQAKALEILSQLEAKGLIRIDRQN